jgi:hypothetical protein
MMQRMVEREFVYNRVMSDETIVTGARTTAESALRFYTQYHESKSVEDPLIGKVSINRDPVDNFPPPNSREFNRLPARIRKRIRNERSNRAQQQQKIKEGNNAAVVRGAP